MLHNCYFCDKGLGADDGRSYNINGARLHFINSIIWRTVCDEIHEYHLNILKLQSFLLTMNQLCVCMNLNVHCICIWQNFKSKIELQQHKWIMIRKLLGSYTLNVDLAQNKRFLCCCAHKMSSESFPPAFRTYVCESVCRSCIVGACDVLAWSE